MTELETIKFYLIGLIIVSPNQAVKAFLEQELEVIQNRIDATNDKIKPWSNLK